MSNKQKKNKQKTQIFWYFLMQNLQLFLIISKSGDRALGLRYVYKTRGCQLSFAIFTFRALSPDFKINRFENGQYFRKINSRVGQNSSSCDAELQTVTKFSIINQIGWFFACKLIIGNSNGSLNFFMNGVQYTPILRSFHRINFKIS